MADTSSQEQVWFAQVGQFLGAMYAAPDRHYHGLSHIHALLNLQHTHAHLIQDQVAVTLAIWFHDAIYDSTRDDNEVQSALLAEKMLSAWGCPDALTASVARKVRATQGHVWTDGDPDTAVFLDFDLGILAASEAAYHRYADQIAQEYAWVPPQAYRLGRAKVLRSFLDRPSLYFTPVLKNNWEAAARANLTKELSGLA